MTPNRWQQIEGLYHAALDGEPEHRAAFLAEACAGDEALRREVEALLAANDRASEFMAAPALELEAKEMAAEKTILLPVGQSISHYKILSPIGAGGMGEVYLARDMRLDRNIALKILPAEFTLDADRLQRFTREAKAASALNHPNIITIHEIGDAVTASGRTHFIATEFIEGITLRQRMMGENLKWRDSLEVAIQIAAALDAAHRASIVHRDIKPENVMLRPDGLIKVLDFGLAKLTAQSPSQATEIDSEARTLTQGMKTAPGMILGTLRYMSPEQARGHAVDARTDIFSLGVVLHEMICGQPLFAGDNTADVIGAILYKEPPPLSQFATEVPAELERIVNKALAKDQQQRYQTVRDLQLDLQTLKQESEFQAQLVRSGANSGSVKKVSSQLSTPAARRFPRWVLALAGALALLVIGGTFWGGWGEMLWRSLFRPAPSLPREMQFDMLFARNDQDSIFGPQSRFSPNGKMIAFSAPGEGENIWVKQISGGGERPITFGKWQDSGPLWSPDGEQIAFISNRGNQVGIWTTPFFNGTPVLLKTLGGSDVAVTRGRQRLVAWAKNESAIYYEWDFRLFRLDFGSKEATLLIAPNQTFDELQDFSVSPTETQIAFIARQDKQYDVWRAGLRGEAPQRVTNDPAVDHYPVWQRDDILLYNSTRDGRQRVYLANLTGGAPVFISTSDHQCQLSDYSVEGKRLLCFERRDESDIFAVQTETGEERKMTNDVGGEFWSNVSPDGQTLLYQAIQGERFVWDPRKSLLFIKSTSAKSPPARLVDDGFEAQWSPNGEQIGFLRLEGQTPNLWTVNPSGGGQKRLMTSNVAFNSYRNSPPYNRLQPKVWCWSPDSARIAYSAKQDGVTNLWMVTVDNAQTTQLSSNLDATVRTDCPMWSPDGQRLAYITWVFGAAERWSLWLTNRQQPGMLFQSEAVIRLLGWAANDRLIVALTDNITGARTQPATVKLVSLTLIGEGFRQQELGSFTETYLSSLHLSPTGRHVAFVRSLNGHNDIWFVSLASSRTGPPKKITGNSDPAFFFGSLAWSPDGKTIYYDKQTRLSLLTMIDHFE